MKPIIRARHHTFSEADRRRAFAELVAWEDRLMNQARALNTSLMGAVKLARHKVRDETGLLPWDLEAVVREGIEWQWGPLGG